MKSGPEASPWDPPHPPYSEVAVPKDPPVDMPDKRAARLSAGLPWGCKLFTTNMTPHKRVLAGVVMGADVQPGIVLRWKIGRF